MNFILTTILPISLGSLAFILFNYLKEKKVITLPFNHYSNKNDISIYIFFSNIFIFILGGIYVLFYAKSIAFSFSFIMVSLIFAIVFRFKFKYNTFGEKILEFTITDKQFQQLKSFEEDGNKKLKVKKFIPNTRKIIFTDKYIMYKKNKKLSVIREKTEQLDLTDLILTENILILKYNFMFTVPTAEYVFYIPDEYKKEVEKIIKIYKQKIDQKK